MTDSGRIEVYQEQEWSQFTISFDTQSYTAYGDGEVMFSDPDDAGVPSTSIRGSITALKELRRAIDQAIRLAEADG